MMKNNQFTIPRPEKDDQKDGLGTGVEDYLGILKQR